MDFLVVIFAAIILVLALFLYLFYRKSKSLERSLNELGFAKNSQSVKYGKLTEHWIPFSDKFPYDPKQFRFIGNPIDGIVFDDDKIVFTEFKTASSQLNERQRKIRELVQKKNVDWLEFRMD